MRLDEYLTTNQLAKTKSKAQNLIKMGFVKVNSNIIKKCGYQVTENSLVKLLKRDDFASLGEFKLQKALKDFSFSVENKICIDIGSSNGGFTKTLLERGAKLVYAVDVAECVFDKDLKDNKKIVIKDRLNAKNMDFDIIGQKVDLIVIDVSFISIKQILPNMKKFLRVDGHIIALIKPQFETVKTNLSKKGIVKSQMLYDRISCDIDKFLVDNQFHIIDKTSIFEYFKDKNKEYFIIMQIY